MSKRILVADDSEDIRILIKNTLLFKGYNVIEANDGQEALEILRKEEPFDLLMTDVAMPRMSGIQLLEKVRKDSKFDDMPVVVCTAEDKVIHEDLVKIGAHSVLSKPFSPKQLLDVVGRLID